jgi:hypothetical protein
VLIRASPHVVFNGILTGNEKVRTNCLCFGFSEIFFDSQPAQPRVPGVVLDSIQLPDAHGARAQVRLPLAPPLCQVEMVGPEDSALQKRTVVRRNDGLLILNSDESCTRSTVKLDCASEENLDLVELVEVRPSSKQTVTSASL